MFPPRRGIIAPLLRSLLRILEWQTLARFPINDQPCNQFTLFLTSHIDPDQTDAQAITQLATRLAENINTNNDFQTAFFNRYGYSEADRLLNENFAEFFCIALPKYLIHKALFELGWRVIYRPTYLYNRPDNYKDGRTYQIMHSVSTFERIPNFGHRLDEPSSGQYTRFVTQVIHEGVKWVDNFVEDPQLREELMCDLDEIVNFRDRPRLG